MVISRKDHKKNIKQFFIYLLILICIIAVGIYVKQKKSNENRQINRYGITTIGRIYYTQNSTRGLWVKYMFKVEDKTYKGARRIYKSNISVGQYYEVVYLPNNPNINRINLSKRLYPEK